MERSEPQKIEIDPEGDLTLCVSVQKSLPIGDVEDATYFRVSSKHLKMASSYFNSVLSDRWPEGRLLAQNGEIEIKFDAFDPDALLIILNVLHFKFRQLPEKMSLQQLVNVAVATDYFRFHEVIAPFATNWLEKMRPKSTKKLYEWQGSTPYLVPKNELANFITIAWIFQATNPLEQFIKQAIKTGTEDFDKKCLPIAEEIKGQ